MTFKKTLALLPTLLVLIALPLRAQTIEVSRDVYVDTPVLPFAAPASGKSAPSAAVQTVAMQTTPKAAEAPAFSLQKGQPIHEALIAWSKANDWELLWQPTVSWRTLRGTTYQKLDVISAVTEVVDTLRFEGKPVALRVSDGNKVMEIISTEIRND